LLTSVTAGQAQAPERVQDLGPADGKWSLDYAGQFGRTEVGRDGREHSGQSFYGLTDRLAIGGETLLTYRRRPGAGRDRLYFSYDSVAAILRFTDPVNSPLGLGVWLQAGLDSDGELARLEARAIAEKKTRRWWTQANLMLRRVNQERAEGTHLAYSARISGAIADGLWLGVESSGQAGRIAGFRRLPFESAYHAGPALLYELPLAARARLRLGATYLRRLDAHTGSSNTVQLSTSIRF
jgi:hypothetical protein